MSSKWVSKFILKIIHGNYNLRLKINIWFWKYFKRHFNSLSWLKLSNKNCKKIEWNCWKVCEKGPRAEKRCTFRYQVCKKKKNIWTNKKSPLHQSHLNKIVCSTNRDSAMQWSATYLNKTILQDYFCTHGARSINIPRNWVFYLEK